MIKILYTYDFLNKLKQLYEMRYKGLKIEIKREHQYENMKKYLEDYSEIIELAKIAIQKADLIPEIHSIRGGTDGSHLSARGIPTPNIFTGGLLFHSKKEYIPKLALRKATEVILHLSHLWTKEKNKIKKEKKGI